MPAFAFVLRHRFLTCAERLSAESSWSVFSLFAVQSELLNDSILFIKFIYQKQHDRDITEKLPNRNNRLSFCFF
jgi:hypothetical protein